MAKPLSPTQQQRLFNMFAAAQQAQRAGLHAQAENLYRDILRQAPEAWEVQQKLALLYATTGRPLDAAKHFRLIVKAHPTYAPGHANLATALAEAGQLEQAIAEFRRALALDENLLNARIALGETLRRAGRFEEAIAEFQRALDCDKVNHAAFNGLGLVYRDLEDMPRALECFEHAVGLAPSNAEYRMNFGAALRRHKLTDLAAQQFYEAVRLRPAWLEAIVLLAETLQQQRRFDEARECYDRALQLQPDNPELIERRGYVYLDMGDAGQALAHFEGVLAQHPKRVMALQGKGRAHLEAGDAAQAGETLEKLVTLHPDHAAGYFHLAASRKFKPEDPMIPQLKERAEKMGDEKKSGADLNFALGKIYDDCKEWDAAWACYARANRLRNEKLSYSAAEDARRFDRLIEAFSAQFMAEAQSLGVESRLPVIIVGMPRSGTTLTEQIISSHPQVVAAGEVEFWLQAYEGVPYLLKTEQPYPECMPLMTAEQAQTIAQRYLDTLHKIAGPGTDPVHITDKMPHNFVHLGLIATIFPNARIIHCKRDAMDNCLSIFFQSFNDWHNYAFDLANLGHHHKQYERIMAHWHAVLPGRIFDIQYEDLIADPEYWSRKLIEHVGLEWDDACLAPHRLERTVKTASHWQVRQPIYKTSVARWKHYEPYLGPLKEALGYE